MMRVKTFLKPSSIHGVGLFADQDIPVGTVVWDYDPQFDLAFEAKDLNSLPDFVRTEIQQFAFWDEVLEKFVLCGDNARFFNHDENANCKDDKTKRRTIAIRDIAQGEELTADYHEWTPPSGNWLY